MSAKSSNVLADHTPAYRGQSLGLPEQGSGSIAPMGRRFLALVIDWLACYLIMSAITRTPAFGGPSAHAMTTQIWATLLLFAELWLPTALIGMSFGKRLAGIRVIRTGGGRPGLGWGLVRTILLFCVVPPCLSDRDLRGLHDRAADTVVVRL